MQRRKCEAIITCRPLPLKRPPIRVPCSAHPQPERRRPGGSQMGPLLPLNESRAKVGDEPSAAGWKAGRRRETGASANPSVQFCAASGLQGQREPKNEFVSGRPLAAAEKSGIRANEAPLRPIRSREEPGGARLRLIYCF